MFEPIIDKKQHLQQNFSFDFIQNSPSLMNPPHRLVLFSLILGLAPKNYLELGTARGGSALILQQAIQCLGNPDFQGACIDVSFSRISSEHRASLERNFRFIEASISVSSVIRAH